jgi:transcription initiation factor TFIIH subunit 4
MNVQIWTFLLQYLELAKEQGGNTIDVLNFFFQLASFEFGHGYSIETLNSTQKQMLEDLKHLGLVFQKKRNAECFYPTRLSTLLTSGDAVGLALETRESSKGYILIETNYRVYAYTDSPLQIAILSLFVAMKAKFANMVLGVLSRDSVREAFSNGITADQIIAFLVAHAHPQMKLTVSYF